MPTGSLIPTSVPNGLTIDQRCVFPRQEVAAEAFEHGLR